MKKLFLVLIILMFALPIFATEYKDTVRVGIADNKFENLYYSTIIVGATSDYVVYDKSDMQTLATLSADKMLKVNFENGKLALYSDELTKSGIKNSIGIKTTGLLKVKDLKRAGKQALYHGEFEIAMANNGHSGFNLINVIALEEYLKGVVPNEMPVGFGLEALKAQTVAARNYTLRPRTVIYHNFDVCDSVQSQVYFGADTEQSLSNRAIEDTKGLFALHDGNLILALYSSTSGGCTENYENVFLLPSWETKIVEPISYLVGKPDKKVDLSTDEALEKFYSDFSDSYDTASRFYRWQVEWDKAELEAVLKKTLAKNAKSGFISPLFNQNDLGNLKDIKILSRGVSGKVISLEIQTDKGCYVVKKELVLRKIFQKNGKMLNSANIIVKNSYDESGNLTNIKFIGGGFGHGVGMSQYGAGHMASDGKKFDDILQHYYTGIAIGTFPVELTSKSDIITQEFSSPSEKGTLIIKHPDDIENFTLIINDVEINLNKDCLLAQNVFKLDRYMDKNNKIIFLPLHEDNKTVRVWVEVYRPKE